MEFVGIFVTMGFVALIAVVAVFSYIKRKDVRYIQFVEYAPTLLTTIGIFGTFFGIVLGLLVFNPNNIEASIPPLLGGLKTAFITSLAGMFSSLILKVLFTLEKSEHSSEVLGEASPEAILEAIQTQIAATQGLKEALSGDDESTLLSQTKFMAGHSSEPTERH